MNLNDTNEGINQIINNDLIPAYNINGGSIEKKGEGNTIFQVTTTGDEMKIFSGNELNTNGLSIVILGKCESLLKQTNGIDENLPLIIKKVEQIAISAERNIQYEVYHPITKKKLNLSICAEETIDVYIPVNVGDKLLNLYKDLKDSGYDLFNINDPFYNDICAPYKSENGTDVLLADRKNDIYNNDQTTCQSNCEYSSFNPEYKFLKCECRVIVDDIDTNDLHKFKKKIFKNFYDVLKNSNYKVMKCYNLVFNWGYFKKNIGSIIVICFFIIYTCFFIIYIIKGISPLKEECLKNISDDKNIITKMKKNSLIISKKKKRKVSKIINKKGINFPPKKKKSVIKKTATFKDIKKKGKRKSHLPLNNQKISIENENSSHTNIQLIRSKTIKKTILKNSDTKTELNMDEKKANEKEKDDIKGKGKNKLDDLDLNNSNYEKALELDKRTLAEIYWSRLKTRHLIIYTFISCHDYNLLYIKISRFIFLLCTSMALNVFFFFDSSMHKIYLDYGNYNFIQQLPQMLYSTIVSLIIEILIGILSYTDINIYQIRQIKKATLDKIILIFKKIKIKLILYFAITFLLFLFYWYFISAFCAVYNNTQVIYIKDFISSFSIGLTYPFIIQFVFALIRIFTLRKNTKVRSVLYKIC